MTLPYPKVQMNINPAADQDESILNVLNDVFHPPGDPARRHRQCHNL